MDSKQLAGMILQKSTGDELRKIHRDIRHGADLSRKVKAWPRIQALHSMKGKESQEKMLLDGQQQWPSWAGFVREAFSRLYTGDRLQSADNGNPVANQLHSLLDDLPEWKRLTERCKGDAYSAGSATMGLGEQLYSQVPKHEHNQQELERLVNLLKDDWQEQQNEAAREGIPSPPKPKDLQKAEADLAKAKQESQNIAKNMNPSRVRQAVRRAVENTNKKLDEIDKSLSGLGWSNEDSGGSTETAAETKRQVADLLKDNETIVRMMEITGRMKNIMRQAQSAKVKHGASELSDIESGADLARLLPSESMLIQHKNGRKLLFKKLLERSALQYQLHSKEKVGKGPVVVCMDDSGSMDGDNEVWAKGLTLALLELARKQDRAFSVCAYSSDITAEYREPKKKKGPVMDLLMFLCRFSGGGTNFWKPMNWGLKEIETSEYLEEADIIFITDGQARMSEDQLDSIKSRLSSTGARCIGIQIGGTSKDSYLNEWCSVVHGLREIVSHTGQHTDQSDEVAKQVLGI